MEGVTPDDWIHRGRLALRLMMVLPRLHYFHYLATWWVTLALARPRNACNQLNYSKTSKSYPILSTIFLTHEIRWKMANVLSDALQVGATYLQHGMHLLKCRRPIQLLIDLLSSSFCLWFLFGFSSYTFPIFTLLVLTLLIFTYFLIFRYSSEGFVKETLLSLAEFLQVTHIYIHTYIHVWLKNEFLCSASRAMNWPANRLRLRFER